MIDQLETTVRKLATSAGRMVGTPGHDAAREYLLGEIESHGLVGYQQQGFELPYTSDGLQFTNLFGVLPGASPQQGPDLEPEPVLLAAHYDTCGPLPGADDNAAAVAILLSMVEPLRRAKLQRSVIFAFFDGEEPPHFLSGSTHFYHHQRQEEVHCALVLDLCGHDVPVPGWEDVLFVTGMESDPGLEPVFRAARAKARGIRTLPALTRYIGDMSDYRSFRLARRPYLFFSCGEWPHYHMPSDTPEKLNYQKMAAISAYLFEVTMAVAAAELVGPFEGYDTTATEIECFQSVAGPLLDELGVQLRTRADMDVLIGQLIDSFGLLS